MRADRLSRWSQMALAATVALCIAGASASAQRVTQQAAPRAAVPRYDVDSAMARATQLRRQNRKAEAERVVARAVEAAPERADARALRDLLHHEVHGGEALLGIDYKSWRRQLPEWREGTLSARTNTELGPAIVRAKRVDRGPLSDGRIDLELYPAFPHGYLALAGGAATNSTVYAKSTVSAEMFGSLTQWLEASAGYRRMNFDTGVDMVGGSVGAYAGQFLLGSRVAHVLDDGGTSVTFSARRFLGDEGAYVGAKLATGSVPVELRTPTDFEVRFSQSVAAETRFVVRRLLVLSVEGELGRDGLSGGGSSEYSAARIGVGVRY
jgi:YaiO family outer membrane protein